jgi:putative transposase
MGLLCRVMEIPRSSARYVSVQEDSEVLERLSLVVQSLLVTNRGFGVQRMYRLLLRARLRVSRSQVRQVYLKLGILKKRAPRRAKTTDSNHSSPRYPNLVKGLEITCPEHVWVADVTYVWLTDRFAYLALLMDAFTRRLVGWAFSLANNTQLTITALKMALAGGGPPKIHHSDQGSTYASPRYIRLLPLTIISMAAVGKPHENGYAERVNRTVKEEEIAFGDYRSFAEAEEAIGAFIIRYNNDRIHSSLGYITPVECLQEWLKKEERT